MLKANVGHLLAIKNVTFHTVIRCQSPWSWALSYAHVVITKAARCPLLIT